MSKPSSTGHRRKAEPIHPALGTRVNLAHLCDAVQTVAGVLDVGASAAEHRVYGQRPSIRVLTESPASTSEARVRKALALLIGTSAAAVLIDVIGPADLPEFGKLSGGRARTAVTWDALRKRLLERVFYGSASIQYIPIRSGMTISVRGGDDSSGELATTPTTARTTVCAGVT